jgi:hypothetical protein
VDAKSVKISCIDGVVLEGFVEHVGDECHDVAFQMLVSTNPEKYKKDGCYAIRWEDILDFKPARGKFQRRLFAMSPQIFVSRKLADSP